MGPASWLVSSLRRWQQDEDGRGQQATAGDVPQSPGRPRCAPWDSPGLLALVPTAAGVGDEHHKGPLGAQGARRAVDGMPGQRSAGTGRGRAPRGDGTVPRRSQATPPAAPTPTGAPEHGKTSDVIFSSEFRVSNMYLFANLIMSFRDKKSDALFHEERL